MDQTANAQRLDFTCRRCPQDRSSNKTMCSTNDGELQLKLSEQCKSDIRTHNVQLRQMILNCTTDALSPLKERPDTVEKMNGDFRCMYRNNWSLSSMKRYLVLSQWYFLHSLWATRIVIIYRIVINTYLLLKKKFQGQFQNLMMNKRIWYHIVFSIAIAAWLF